MEERTIEEITHNETLNASSCVRLEMIPRWGWLELRRNIKNKFVQTLLHFLGAKQKRKETILKNKYMFLILWYITPPQTPHCPVPCCRSSSMCFQVELISHSMILNHRHVQIFSIPNISQASLPRWWFSLIASLIIHSALLHQLPSDLRHLSVISQKLLVSENQN